MHTKLSTNTECSLGKFSFSSSLETKEKGEGGRMGKALCFIYYGLHLLCTCFLLFEEAVGRATYLDTAFITV